MFPLALFLAFLTAVITGYWVLPAVYGQGVGFQQRRAQQFTSRLERVVSRPQAQRIIQLYLLAPLFLAGVMYFTAPARLQILAGAAGLALGLVVPTFYTRILVAGNKKKFDEQLIDTLMIMSSSFRGGLSLMQSIEAVVEEMSDPAAQEFGTVLGENKMGVSLEESMEHLYNRQPSPSLQQMITAILLARETGGNLPAIFQRIVDVIRQRRRIQGQIDTLTLQGKIQGVVMSILPVAFFMIISSTNPDHFKVMFDTEIGRILLLGALVAEIIGAYMIWQISSLKDF